MTGKVHRGHLNLLTIVISGVVFRDILLLIISDVVLRDLPLLINCFSLTAVLTSTLHVALNAIGVVLHAQVMEDRVARPLE